MTTSTLLVGSVSQPDAESTFRLASEHLAGTAARIPDGEVGKRYYWIQFQNLLFESVPGLVRIGEPGFYIRDEFDTRPITLADGVDAESIVFPALGYADAAIESYATFVRLRSEGVIPAGVRFQVSLPTPAGVVGSFFELSVRAAIEPVYERAILREVDAILAAIPHDDLAIQWDTALEFGLLDRATIFGHPMTAWFGDTHEQILAGVLERGLRQAAAVPADVELGYHLCYGDVEESHFHQPTDAATLAEVAAGLLAGSPRAISWIHLPVPIERDDAAYFAPLETVEWGDTELFLGLVHHEDGVDGALRRAAAAAPFVPAFGVSTECGFARGPVERTVPLLDLHAEVAAAL
ncbi:hypothetical protein HD599_002371 [Conyzicola lurida]|uniref:5-methyltetrahydropteroyltriglutamate--homocysteine methyltransferase n=1 Tax=Conyzicola lurida TaxID=1172621 RepID=A0A841AP00_9MICO|nr:hypothetical protein [Conyzicola lurida]